LSSSPPLIFQHAPCRDSGKFEKCGDFLLFEYSSIFFPLKLVFQLFCYPKPNEWDATINLNAAFPLMIVKNYNDDWMISFCRTTSLWKWNIISGLNENKMMAFPSNIFYLLWFRCYVISITIKNIKYSSILLYCLLSTYFILLCLC